MHRRPRLSLPLLAALLAVVVAVGVGSAWWWTHRPLDVAVPAGGADATCARLATGLPDRLVDQARRSTSSDSPAVAAWGDPAVLWRCGVTPPGPTSDQCLAVDGVDWIASPLDDGTAFTTYGREPAVQVLVPDRYAPEPLVLPGLSAVVVAVPQGERRCT